MNVKEIRELRDFLVQVYHAKRIQEQEKDEKYYRDTFDVPWVQDKTWIVRTGKGARMVDGPAEHIITASPQYFRDIRRKGTADADARVASECNHWLQIMLHQNPQPFKQAVKHLLRRGSAWIYTVHNENFDKDDKNDMPVVFTLLDPLAVFLDPEGGERNGVPARVVVSFERRASVIKANYPYWTWKNREGRKDNDKVGFFMYWDKDTRYFEAANEALLADINGNLSNGDGQQENIYGLVPFEHFYSGFGSATLDGDPADLEVGRLRFVRDLLAEQCAIRSVLNTIIHKYAHKPQDLIYDPLLGAAPSGDIQEKYSREMNAFNVIGIPGYPSSATFKAGEDELPDQQLFQHLYNIEKQINEEDPLGTIGQAIGTSGRQQDMASQATLRRYDTIVENTAQGFATAFAQGLQMVEKLKLYPSGIKEGDIGKYYEGQIELKAEDQVSTERLALQGERLYLNGQIDLETNLIKYQGYTQEEAQLIMARILADNATRNNPLIAQIMGEQAAREIGMEQQYQALKAQTEMMEKSSQKIPATGSEGGPPRIGNIQSPMGMEMADMNNVRRSQRQRPEAVT